MTVCKDTSLQRSYMVPLEFLLMVEYSTLRITWDRHGRDQQIKGFLAHLSSPLCNAWLPSYKPPKAGHFEVCSHHGGGMLTTSPVGMAPSMKSVCFDVVFANMCVGSGG